MTNSRQIVFLYSRIYVISCSTSDFDITFLLYEQTKSSFSASGASPLETLLAWHANYKLRRKIRKMFDVKSPVINEINPSERPVFFKSLG